MDEGLFQKAIIQSGGGFCPGFNQDYNSLEQQEKIGEGFLQYLGVSSIEEARKIDAKTLYEKAVEYPVPIKNGRPSLKWNMVIDGKFLKEDPVSAILHKRRWPVPLMMGNTLDEFPAVPPFSSLEDVKTYAQAEFGENAGEYLSLCDFASGDLEHIRQKATYNAFELGNLLWAEKNADLGKLPIYLYRFNPEMPGDSSGSFHSSELWFVFETLAKCWRPFRGKHYDLARQICNYWTNFAKTGNPNGPDDDGSPMPYWEPYTESSPRAMYFGDAPAMDEEGYSDLMHFLLKEGLKKLDCRKE